MPQSESIMDFLTSKQVDYLQWDNTISNDPYTPVYAYSWYLDVVANNWGGIVSSGYKSILPLTP